MRKSSPKNVLTKEGKARRVPGDVAEQMIANGQAKHYISNTVYRAMKLGIEVKDPKTRDEKGQLRAKVRDARDRAHKRAAKKAEKDARKAEREAEQEAHDEDRRSA